MDSKKKRDEIEIVDLFFEALVALDLVKDIVENEFTARRYYHMLLAYKEPTDRVWNKE